MQSNLAERLRIRLSVVRVHASRPREPSDSPATKSKGPVHLKPSCKNSALRAMHALYGLTKPVHPPDPPKLPCIELPGAVLALSAHGGAPQACSLRSRPGVQSADVDPPPPAEATCFFASMLGPHSFFKLMFSGVIPDRRLLLASNHVKMLESVTSESATNDDVVTSVLLMQVSYRIVDIQQSL